MRVGRRLPDLGPRGEGWFLIQVLLMATIAAAGLLGPAWSGWLRAVGVLVGAASMGAGGLLAIRGVLDLGSLITPFPRPRDGVQLVATGAYALVRHPIYGGLILGGFGWGTATASPASLVGTVVLGLFFDLKSRREEAWLVERLPSYESYRRRTRRLVPWLY